MTTSLNTQVALLLTARFTKSVEGEPSPLSPTEWGRLTQWLASRSIPVHALLSADDPGELLAGWDGRGQAPPLPERIRHLLGRGGALGIVLERWERAGLWVMGDTDSDYPERLTTRLEMQAPAVLFGCGSRRLLGQGGIAVVGSRHVGADDLAFAAGLGGEIARQGFAVVSGGARGVDDAAMQGALAVEGTAVGVLPDSLLRAATSAKYRRALMEGDAVLVSPFSPDAGFSVGNAMGRNKLIYCFADAAVVVMTQREGGTWQGATENLRQRWVPLWVKRHHDSGSANAALVGKGAAWLPEGTPDIRSLLQPLATAPVFQRPFQAPATGQLPGLVAESAKGYGESTLAGHDVGALTGDPYELFLERAELLTRAGPVAQSVLEEQLAIPRKQLDEWLKRGVMDGRLVKLTRPLRYQGTRAVQPKLDL